MSRRHEMTREEEPFVASRFSMLRGPWHVLRVDGTTVCGRTVPGTAIRRHVAFAQLDVNAKCVRCWAGRYSCETMPVPSRQLELFAREPKTRTG